MKTRFNIIIISIIIIVVVVVVVTINIITTDSWVHHSHCTERHVEPLPDRKCFHFLTSRRRSAQMIENDEWQTDLMTNNNILRKRAALWLLINNCCCCSLLYVAVAKTVVTCKIKHLQNICKNVLVSYFTCNHVLPSIWVQHTKTSEKMFCNIFTTVLT